MDKKREQSDDVRACSFQQRNENKVTSNEKYNKTSGIHTSVPAYSVTCNQVHSSNAAQLNEVETF